MVMYTRWRLKASQTGGLQGLGVRIDKAPKSRVGRILFGGYATVTILSLIQHGGAQGACGEVQFH